MTNYSLFNKPQSYIDNVSDMRYSLPLLMKYQSRFQKSYSEMGFSLIMNLAQIESKNMVIQFHQSGTNFAKQHLISFGSIFSRNVTRQLSVVSLPLQFSLLQRYKSHPIFANARKETKKVFIFIMKSSGQDIAVQKRNDKSFECKEMWLDMNVSNENYEETIMPADNGGNSLFQP